MCSPIIKCNCIAKVQRRTTEIWRWWLCFKILKFSLLCAPNKWIHNNIIWCGYSYEYLSIILIFKIRDRNISWNIGTSIVCLQWINTGHWALLWVYRVGGNRDGNQANWALIFVVKLLQPSLAKACKAFIFNLRPFFC
jgi:hypothetical protein